MIKLLITPVPYKIGDIDIHFKFCTISSDNIEYTFVAPEDYINSNKVEIMFEDRKGLIKF